ncbi:MAG TPA: hypothetical protein VNT42_05185 [Sphingomonas sp.]|nr:hypothetical protein [Sphingomonas sp.]
MSGVGLVAAAANAPAPAPLSVYLAWHGPTPLNVAGASGVAEPTASPWSPNVIVVIITGGVEPYQGSLALENNPSGKLSLVNASDNTHATIGWTNFAINESEATDMVYVCTDSVGTIVTARWSGIIIRRTS